MKLIYLLMGAAIATTFFSNCAGNKDLQKRAPAQFEPAFYSYYNDVLRLSIPVAAIQTNRITLDSVYFHGKVERLMTDDSIPGIYYADFKSEKQDIIMSIDPKDEYSNKVPDISSKSYFELKNDEAVVVFTESGKIKYYKLTGIQEKK